MSLVHDSKKKEQGKEGHQAAYLKRKGEARGALSDMKRDVVVHDAGDARHEADACSDENRAAEWVTAKIRTRRLRQ
jgi:hypothetical protein